MAATVKSALCRVQQPKPKCRTQHLRGFVEIDIDPVASATTVNTDAILTIATTLQSRARAFLGVIEQVANDSLSPEEFEQLTTSDPDARRILDRSLRVAHDRLGRYLRYFGQLGNDL